MTTPPGGVPPGEQASAISRLVVQTMAEYTGHGPVKARTYIAEDCISVVLEETLTKGERSLVREGETQTVLAMRRAYQRAASEVLIKGIEHITTRDVIAFLSANHINPDYAVETFILKRHEVPEPQTHTTQ